MFKKIHLKTILILYWKDKLLTLPNQSNIPIIFYYTNSLYFDIFENHFKLFKSILHIYFFTKQSFMVHMLETFVQYS